MTKQARGTTRTASAQRLREALTTMVRQRGGSASPPALTAAALCDLAGISRNALYRYHPDVVQALHAAHQKHLRHPDNAGRAARLRRDNAALREQLTKLAALVDHYFAAWQETRLQLERRDRELAEVRRAHKPQVVSLQR
jgi:AcrR family transcriptional regulator